ncbi:MAG: DNA-protecting protein DprA [Rhodobiaceae bacterium]|nr:DNA-protecting protein DprA [Rhodobiaceae bacterium]
MPATLSEQERLDRLRLIRSENVGPVTFRDLLQQFGSAGDALDALPELAKRGGRKRAIKIASSTLAKQEMNEAHKLGAELLFVGEKAYPPLLSQADPPPPVIAALGALHLLEKPSLAIVGSRSASAAGLRMAATLSRDLGDAGYVITSGLARGIDAAAHKATLATGTIAVVAGGLDIVYPEENRDLYEKIKEQGVLVSEMPPGTRPQGRHFPRRNRIIAGLSQGVIVVEAALRSGSLITARFALEQNREVMVVPGSPLDPRAKGGNRLIKQGAALVESADDILNWLEQSPPPLFSEGAEMPYASPQAPPPEPSNSERQHLYSLLGPTPVEQDELIRLSGLPARTVIALLLEADLAGRLVRESGQRVSFLEEQPEEVE